MDATSKCMTAGLSTARRDLVAKSRQRAIRKLARDVIESISRKRYSIIAKMTP
jgi:hypothetical protein